MTKIRLNNIFFFIFTIIFIGLSLDLLSQDSIKVDFSNLLSENDSYKFPVKFDTTHIIVRQPINGWKEKYLSDEDFNYEIKPQKPSGFWSWLGYWFKKMMNSMFYSTGSFKTVMYFIFVLLIVLLALKLLNVDFKMLFFKDVKKTGTVSLSEDEIIKETDIDELIDNEVARGNYRNAIRLLYVNLLKKLWNSGNIEWQINKTNRDYQRELRKTKYIDDFRSLTKVFEYFWYGNFPVDKTLFVDIRQGFDNIYKNIN